MVPSSQPPCVFLRPPHCQQSLLVLWPHPSSAPSQLLSPKLTCPPAEVFSHQSLKFILPHIQYSLSSHDFFFPVFRGSTHWPLLLPITWLTFTSLAIPLSFCGPLFQSFSWQDRKLPFLLSFNPVRILQEPVYVCSHSAKCTNRPSSKWQVVWWIDSLISTAVFQILPHSPNHAHPHPVSYLPSHSQQVASPIF